jgi:hypothetical protein
MTIAEPILDAYQIDDAYACRKGKGTRKAVLKAKKFSAAHDWYLKMDIRRYFDSIDHEILLKLLSRKFKDKELNNLFRTLLGTYHTKNGKGLPIGNLISQHFANFYLATFDHWIKEERKIKGYLRYMDDFIVFGDKKETLKKELRLIESYLSEFLELKLKDATQLNRCQRGMPFLGYRIFPNDIRLAPASKKRFIRKFKQYEANCKKRKWTEKELLRHIEPLIEFTKLADSVAFRKGAIKRFGVLKEADIVIISNQRQNKRFQKLKNDIYEANVTRRSA